MYLSAPQPTAKNRMDVFSIQSSSVNLFSPSPSTSSLPDRSLSFKELPRTHVEANCCLDILNLGKGLSNADLYHHYLQHTSRTLSLCPFDHSVLHNGMPTLALQSETVFHSILAVSAVSLAWNMISEGPPPDTKTVNRVLLTGYQHYNIASEQMRESISGLGASKLEVLIASALILVPFATASQQINHWISSRSDAQVSHRLLSSTPRDVIIIMRGIRTMLQTLDCGGLSTNADLSPRAERGIDESVALPAVNPRFTALASSHTHAMSAMVAATSRSAFFKLKQRLDMVLSQQIDCLDTSLSACSAAFNLLDQIRGSAIRTLNSSPSASLSSLFTEHHSPKAKIASQIAPWLRSFACQSTMPGPTQPLTRLFLSFLVQAPQDYLDLVLPLLDQRLETPIGAFSDSILTGLTRKQALALDIYAHWSVFMFLVEEESWWIGKLPVITLVGMMNRYSNRFVSRLWPGDQSQKEQWWPESMLNILQETKRYI
jgi:hypothetical protein